MDLFIFLVGFLAIMLGLVLIVFNLIKKGPIKKYFITVLVGLALFITGGTMGGVNQNQASEVANKEKFEMTSSEEDKELNLSDSSKTMLSKTYDSLTGLDKEEILVIKDTYDSYNPEDKEFIDIHIKRLDEEKEIFEVQEQQARDQEAQEQQAREQEAQEQQAREQEAQEQQVREQQAQEQQAREQQAQEQQVREQQAQEQQVREQQAQEQQVQQQSSTNEVGSSVFVTPTGSKYHTGKCGNGNYTQATLEQAKARGLTPCSKCY